MSLSMNSIPFRREISLYTLFSLLIRSTVISIFAALAPPKRLSLAALTSSSVSISFTQLEFWSGGKDNENICSLAETQVFCRTILARRGCCTQRRGDAGFLQDDFGTQRVLHAEAFRLASVNYCNKVIIMWLLQGLC